MTVIARRVLSCWALVGLVATAGCAQQVGGLAVLPATERPLHPPLVDVDTVMLDISRMRGITGAGDDLTIIPSMDTKYPVDVDLLAKDMPAECRFVVTETATFGTDIDDFHKTTFQKTAFHKTAFHKTASQKTAFQDPPGGGMISQAAAAYRDAATARGVFDDLVRTVRQCGGGDYGPLLVGDWTATGDALRTRSGGCGRDYRLKSVVLIEVTFCGFPDSVSDIVMTNILSRVPN